MNNKNMSYAFFKDYWRALETAVDAGGVNTQLLRIINGAPEAGSAKNDILYYGQMQIKAISAFRQNGVSSNIAGYSKLFQKRFSVEYPGALIGSGYPHMMGKKKGEIQNGFCFDHISGSPYYPGSSLKGLLEDPFQRALSGRTEEREGYLYYVTRIIEEKTGKKGLTKEDVANIWRQSFQGIVLSEKSQDDINEDKQKQIQELRECMYDRDVFYDAYVTNIGNNPYNSNKDILGLDYITPHEKLKDPTPVTILRMMPGVELTFTMFLHDVKKPQGGVLLSADEKAEVFVAIIEDMGIGSKTNLGYGVLKSVR